MRKNAQIDIQGLFQTNLNQLLEAVKKMSSIAKDKKKSVKLHVFEFFLSIPPIFSIIYWVVYPSQNLAPIFLDISIPKSIH